MKILADLTAHEPQRVALYKATVALVRAYACIGDELDLADTVKAILLASRRTSNVI